MNSEEDFAKISYEHRVVFHLVELMFRGSQQTHVCLTINGPPQVASGYFPEVPQKTVFKRENLREF